MEKNSQSALVQCLTRGSGANAIDSGSEKDFHKILWINDSSKKIPMVYIWSGKHNYK